MKKINDYSIQNAVDNSITYRTNLDLGFWNISREDGNILKGIAIILMFVHHVFIPTYVSDLSGSSYFLAVGQWCKICVPFFAFLSGWFFAKGKKKNFPYIVRKSCQFYFSYFLVLSIIVAIAVSLCQWEPSYRQLIYELFPIGKQRLMVFCWYVIFYPLVLFILSCCEACYDHIPRRFRTTSAVILITASLYEAETLGNFCLSIHQYAMASIAFWLPSPIIGYCLSKSKRFSNFCQFCQKGKLYYVFFYTIAAALIVHLWLLAFPILKGGGYFSDAISFLWGSGIKKDIVNIIYVIAFLLLVSSVQVRIIRTFFIFLGKISMNLWFLHCLFFSPITSDVFQPFITLIPHPLFTLIALLAFCIPLAIILQYLQQNTTKKILAVAHQSVDFYKR